MQDHGCVVTFVMAVGEQVGVIRASNNLTANFVFPEFWTAMRVPAACANKYVIGVQGG